MNPPFLAFRAPYRDRLLPTSTDASCYRCRAAIPAGAEVMMEPCSAHGAFIVCLTCVAPATLEGLAEQLLTHEAAAEVARAALLLRMEGAGVKRVDVAGAGHVVYVEASTSTPIDVKACAEKLAKLGAELRALGRDPDDGVPLKPSSRRAGLRVNLR